MNNNTIKFRVWNKKTSQFLTNTKASPKSILFDLWGWVDEMSTCLLFPINDYVFQQFTGFKDRNHKEIYEGDILLIFFQDSSSDWLTPMTCEVLFEQDCGGYIVKWKGNSRSQNYESFTCDVAIYATVIGNIIENPELLK